MTPTILPVLAAAASTAAHPRVNLLGLIPLAVVIGAVVLARNLSRRHRRAGRAGGPGRERPRLPETGRQPPPAAPAEDQPGGHPPEDRPGG